MRRFEPAALVGMLFFTLLAIAGFGLAGGPAAAQQAAPVSQCQAIAERLPAVRHVVLTGARPAQAGAYEVTITYVTHSTYRIETPQGVIIATDYAGYAGSGVTPTVATMNKAHSSHFTSFPDPAIEHVLTGWNPDGGPIDHDLVVGDVYIRNVTTDIRAGAGMEADANSIFIFEVAGLCIGHLGHLHHVLEDRHYRAIGRLDIVMVPVDGGLTMGTDRMAEVVERLRASIILPMHRFGQPISAFIDLFEGGAAADIRAAPSFTVSLRSLPDRPTVVVLDGV